MTKNIKQIELARAVLLEGIGVPEPSEFKPDPFQLDSIRSVKEGHDTLVIAPTGSGKTYIAVQAIEAVVREGKRAVYTAPLKALSNAKFSEFKKRFEPEFSVGLLTGDRKIEGDADIVVATTEIYRNELYDLQASYGVVVLDEFHYLSDLQRGPVWEESVILSSRDSTLLMLSASISNEEEVAEWIGEVRGREVTIIREEERSVELRLAFLHPEYGVIPLEDERGKTFGPVNRFYAGKSEDSRNNKFRGRGPRGGRRRKTGKGRGK